MRAIVYFVLITAPSLWAAPQSVDELYADFDPRSIPLEMELVREWQEGDLTIRYVRYLVGEFKGKKSRIAAFYGFPAGKKDLPGLLHAHGGGQRAFLGEVKRFADRGYAVLSINWGGREMEQAKPNDPNTDWGAVDPTQRDPSGYSNLLPGPNFLDPDQSARNNHWYLLNLAARRGLTYLERQPEVDGKRLGVYGHSMGGRITGLVAGSDARVVACSPSVGGSGFLQTDFSGIPNSGRRVRGDLDLFRRTMAGQAYLQRITCPILYLSATNDFNAPMDHVARGMRLVPAAHKAESFAIHLNHRFTPEFEICRPLWFDHHLMGKRAFPKGPQAQFHLKTSTGIPFFVVRPDPSIPAQRIDVYYSYGRDPRNRFWAQAEAVREGGVWKAKCPIFDLEEPLFACANVAYPLTEPHPGDPKTFVLSTFRAAYPKQLREAGVKVTEKSSREIDGIDDWGDWYSLNASNRHHWFYATRKMVDPRWAAPAGARLQFEVYTEVPNMLGVELQVDTWRNYTGRPKKAYDSLVTLDAPGWHRVLLSPSDFIDASGAVAKSWYGITEFSLRPGKRLASRKVQGEWQGAVAKFRNLKWVGGVYGDLPKPYRPVGGKVAAGGYNDEFQDAIDRSIQQEQLDRAGAK